MTDSLTFSDSIVIAASPEAVYDVVADVTRTGEWSPVCQECWWDEGDGPRVGAHFTGRNVTPARTWETRSEVTAAERGVRFAWSVNGGTVLWGYEMRAVGGGTVLTEWWEFTAEGQAWFGTRYGDRAAAEIADRTRAAHEGIPVTLAAVKRVVEGR